MKSWRLEVMAIFTLLWSKYAYHVMYNACQTSLAASTDPWVDKQLEWTDEK